MILGAIGPAVNGFQPVGVNQFTALSPEQQTGFLTLAMILYFCVKNFKLISLKVTSDLGAIDLICTQPRGEGVVCPNTCTVSKLM